MRADEIRKIKIEQIPKSELLKEFDNKPNIVFLVPLIIGILMVIFGIWQLKLFGLVFILFSIYVWVKFKKEKVVDMYTDFFIIYDPDSEYVTIIRWDEIETWDLQIGGSSEDRIFIETSDGYIYSIGMFGIAKVAVYFRKFVFDKNKHEKYKQQENAKGSSALLFRKRNKK